MFDLFISYAHKDQDFVSLLVSHFEAEGWSVWWDRAIGSGTEFDAEIEEALEQSARVVVIWSATSIDSHWVRAEAHEGLDRGILIPVLIENLRPPLAFRQIQTINLFDKPDDFECVVKAIRSSFSGDSMPLLARSAGAPANRGGSHWTRLLKPALLAVVVVLLGSLLLLQIRDDQPISSTASQVDKNSVAVLPFLNLSANTDNDYFSDGISEEILNRLATIKGLAVIARTSSFALRNSKLSIAEIGDLLKVANVLEGGVRQIGNKVRVNVQLVNAASGSLIWSSAFDRELTDIFAIQEEIAGSIASALEIQLAASQPAAIDARSTTDLAAYDLYLLGRYHSHSRTTESINKSIKLFKQAIAGSPGFVLPYTGLADAYNLLTAYGNLSGPRAAEMMEPVVQKALALDGTLAEAHTSLGALRDNLGDLDGAEEAYRHAIELNANYSLASMWLGNVLVSQNRLIEAEKVFSEARQLDPLNPAVNLNLARVRLDQGHFDEGMALIDQVLKLDPDNAGAREQKVYWMVQYGRYSDAAKLARQAEAADPNGAHVLSTLAQLQLLQGDFEGAQDWLNRASQAALNNWTVIWIKSEFLYLSGETKALDTYSQERLQIVAQSKVRSSRDLKSAYLWAGLARLLLNDSERAAAYFEAGYVSSQYSFDADAELLFMAWRALANQQSTESGRGDETLDDAVRFAATAKTQGWATPGFLAQSAAVQVLQGNDDRALENLQLAIDAGYRNFLALQQDPIWSKLRSDPRFQRLITVTD